MFETPLFQLCFPQNNAHPTIQECFDRTLIVHNTVPVFNNSPLIVFNINLQNAVQILNGPEIISKIFTRIDFQEYEQFDGILYILIAILSHIGPNVYGGHFIANVRVGERILCFNDETVSQGSFVNYEGQANMLFYRRVDDVVSPTVTIQDVFDVLPLAARYTLPIPQEIVNLRVQVPEVVVNAPADIAMPDQDNFAEEDHVFFFNFDGCSYSKKAKRSSSGFTLLSFLNRHRKVETSLSCSLGWILDEPWLLGGSSLNVQASKQEAP